MIVLMRVFWMVGGKAESVKLCQVDLDRWQRSGVTISVHDCSTPSKERYRILFDSTTIYHIDKRFPGPAVKVNYSAEQLHYTIILRDVRANTCIMINK